MIGPKALFIFSSIASARRESGSTSACRLVARLNGIKEFDLGLGSMPAAPCLSALGLLQTCIYRRYFTKLLDERRNLIRSHIESKVAAVDNVYLSIWHVATIGLRL
jgi:hypothetical protein